MLIAIIESLVSDAGEEYDSPVPKYIRFLLLSKVGEFQTGTPEGANISIPILLYSPVGFGGIGME